MERGILCQQLSLLLQASNTALPSQNMTSWLVQTGLLRRVRLCGIAPQDINLLSNTINENTPPNTEVADITVLSDLNDTPEDG